MPCQRTKCILRPGSVVGWFLKRMVSGSPVSFLIVVHPLRCMFRLLYTGVDKMYAPWTTFTDIWASCNDKAQFGTSTSNHVVRYVTWYWGRRLLTLLLSSRQGLGIFLTTVSRTALGPTQPPNQWVPGTLSLGIKRPGHEAGHSPPPSVDVKECVELYFHSPIHLHGVVISLKKNHRDNFSLPFTLIERRIKQWRNG
jgi:hypothetical protein